MKKSRKAHAKTVRRKRSAKGKSLFFFASFAYFAALRETGLSVRGLIHTFSRPGLCYGAPDGAAGGCPNRLDLGGELLRRDSSSIDVMSPFLYIVPSGSGGDPLRANSRNLELPCHAGDSSWCVRHLALQAFFARSQGSRQPRNRNNCKTRQARAMRTPARAATSFGTITWPRLPQLRKQYLNQAAMRRQLEEQGQAPALMTEREVTKEAESAAAETVIKEVHERGVDFDLTHGIEKKLRKANASDEVIEAVRQAGHERARADREDDPGTHSGWGPKCPERGSSAILGHPDRIGP